MGCRLGGVERLGQRRGHGGPLSGGASKGALPLSPCQPRRSHTSSRPSAARPGRRSVRPLAYRLVLTAARSCVGDVIDVPSVTVTDALTPEGSTWRWTFPPTAGTTVEVTVVMVFLVRVPPA